MYSLCHRMKEIPNDKVEEQTAGQQMEQADVNEFPQNNISMAQIENASETIQDNNELNLTNTGIEMRKALFISVAYSANIGGTGVVTGTGPNIVLMGILDE